jgi:uncharacterized membrane protein
MAELETSITINAPIEKVFAFLTDPRNLPEIWPSMIEVKHVTPAPKGGFNFEWVYKMAGMQIEGASETVEYVLNERTVTKGIKGIESKFTWLYKPLNKTTKLTVEIEYKVPLPLLGKLAEAVVLKRNEQEAETLLFNLKSRLEIETPISA